MIESIKITPEFSLWGNILGGRRKKDLELNFNSEMINVIASPNGSGKTTIMKSIESLVFNKEDDFRLKRSEDGKVIGLSVKARYKKDQKRKPMFFIGIDDLAPDRQKNNISPWDKDSSIAIAYWFDKGTKSHGQSNFECIEDLITVASKGDLIWIDEPELALDMTKMIDLVELLKNALKNTQIVVISHHPFFVLNKEFNVIELDGTNKYQNASRKALKSLNLGL